MWVIRRRTRPIRKAASTPIATPPPAAQANCQPTSATLTEVPSATSPIRTMTRAVASLNSDSPSSRLTSCRGSPMRLATVVAATASGGATTPPNAMASGSGTPSSHQTTRPTPSAVKITRPTESSAMPRRFARRSISDVRMAAAYSSGGSSPRSTISRSTSISGTPGRYPTPMPTTVSSSGAEVPTRRARVATNRTTATRATTKTASSTR